MRTEQLQQANNAWSRRLGSLAVVATDAFPDIRSGKVDTYDALRDEGHYYKAIDRVLTAAQTKSMPIRSRLSAALMKTSSFRDSLNTEIFTPIATGRNSDRIRSWYQSFEQRHMARMTDVIEELAHNESDPNLQRDVAQIADGIRSDDKKLKLKITLDGLKNTVSGTDLHPYMQSAVFRRITDAVIPELQHQDPSTITPELLFELQNYGLMEYVDLSRHLVLPIGLQQEVGYSYRINMSFMGRPERQHISGVSYEERMATWQRESGEYEAQREQVAREMNTLETHQNPTDDGIFRGYDDEWVAANLDTVGRVLSAVLDNDVTSRIIDACDPTGHRQVIDVFMHSPSFSARNINGVRTAIAAMYAHTRDFPTQDNMRLMLSALDSFRYLTMGLYDLEAKSR